MIPTTYKTEAEALAIRNAGGEGSLLAPITGTTGNNNASPGLGGVLSADAIQRIQTNDLTGPTAVIDTVNLGGTFTAADAALIDGIRSRLSASITEFYATRPNLSPLNSNNKQSGQSDANVIDNFIQVIFKYDARYGQRLRLDEVESITRLDTGEYVLPNRTSFIKNAWVEATMRIHGPSDIATIDDTGTGGAYRVTTTTKHGLYDGQLLAANPAVTAPSTTTEVHVAKTVTKLTQEATTSSTAPTNSYYTTSATHYFVDGQKFVPSNAELGVSGLDAADAFWGYQRDRYIKVLSPTTFELHRNFACTDRITTGYYSGTMNFSQEGTGLFYVSGTTMQTIDGAPILFESDTPADPVCVFQQDVVSSVDTSTGIWSKSVGATIKSGIQDGMLTNFNNFTGVNWSGVDAYNYPLYFKKLTDTSFTLHTSPTTLDSTTLWKPGTSSNNDLDAIQYTSSTWTATFTRPHNVLNGQDFRMRSVTEDFGGQQIASYTYASAGSANNYWTMDNTSDHILDGSRITIGSGTSQGAGTTFDIAATQVTVPQNGLYVKRRGASGSKQLQLFTDAAMTTQWEPYSTVGTHTVETNTFLANIYFAKVVNSTTIQLYAEPTLTTKWNPSLGSGAVTAIASGATGNTLGTEVATTFSSPGGGYIQPMFFPKTAGYTFIALYKDKALTLPYTLPDGNIIPGSPATTDSSSGYLRMNPISHYMSWVDNGNSTTTSEVNFTGNPTIYPAFYVDVVSDTVFDLKVKADLTVPYTTPAIGTTGVGGGMIAAIYQQSGNFRLDKIIGRNLGLLTYFYNNYDLGTTLVNAQPNTTFYTAHYETNGVYDYVGNNLHWPALSVTEYSNSNAGIYYGHLRPIKAGSSDAGNTGRLGVSTTDYGVTQGSPMYYALNQPGRFNSGNSMILGIKTQANVGTYTEDPLDFNGAQWDQGSVGQPYRDWPQTVQPVSLTWTIEQPTQVLETVNMNRYTRTRDISQYRLKLTYPPMTSSQIQEYISIIHAAGGAYKPFKFWFPRNNNIAMTVSMQNKSPQTANHFFVREGLTAGTKIIKVDGLPQNKTQNDPAFFAGAGLNMRISNGMGSMMVPVANVRTNEYGEANIRINNGIPASIPAGEWMDSYINYLDVFLDGNSIDIKVDTRGYHYLEVDMVTKRVF